MSSPVDAAASARPPAVVDARDLPSAVLASAYDAVLAPSFEPAELCTREEFVTAFADGGSLALVALAGERPVGVAMGELYADGEVLLLAYLAAAPCERAAGTGGVLLEEALARWGREVRPAVVLAEVEDPQRHGDRGFGDPARRLRFYGRHRARRLALRHVQPALRPGLPRVRDLVLLAWTDADEVPNATVRRFLDEYFDACEGVPGLLDPERASVRGQVAGPGAVPLLPLPRAPEPGRAAPPGLRGVVERDDPVLEVLARALTADDPAARAALDRAWTGVDPTWVSGAAADELRSALAARLLEELRPAAAPGGSAPADERFLPEEDRWAGWWVDGPAGWPPGWNPPPAQVLAALRDLPLEPRVLLLLCDVVGLPGPAVARLTGLDGDPRAALLRGARTDFVRRLQARVTPA